MWEIIWSCAEIFFSFPPMSDIVMNGPSMESMLIIHKSFVGYTNQNQWQIICYLSMVLQPKLFSDVIIVTCIINSLLVLKYFLGFSFKILKNMVLNCHSLHSEKIKHLASQSYKNHSTLHSILVYLFKSSQIIHNE